MVENTNKSITLSWSDTDWIQTSELSKTQVTEMEKSLWSSLKSFF